MVRPPLWATLGAALAWSVATLASFYDGAAVHASAWVFRGVLLGCVCWLWPRPRRRGIQPSAAQIWVGAGLVAAAALGWWRAPQFFVGAEGAVALACAGLVFAALWGQAAGVQLGVLTALAALACCHAVVATLQRAWGLTSRGHGGFFNPNDLAALLAPTAVVAVNLALGPQRSRSARALWWACAGICTVGVGASASRSGLLAGGLGLTVALAVHWTTRVRPQARRRRRAGKLRRRQTAALPLLAVATLATMALSLGHRGRADAADPYAYSRLEIWRASFAQMLAVPWGHGFGGAAPALARLGVAVTGPVRYPALANHAHSEWLQAGLELGLVGFVGSAGSALALAWALGRRPGPQRAQLGVWLSLAIPALTGATLHQPPVAALAASWAACAWPNAHRPSPPGSWADLGDLGGAALGRQRLLRRLPFALRRRRAVAWSAAALLLCTLPAAVGQVFANKGHAALRRGEPQQAYRWLQRACLAAPWDPGHLLHRADAAVLGGAAADGGEAAYLAVAELFADRVEPWQRLAEVRSRRATDAQAWSAAAQAWAQAAAQQPHAALLWVQAAEAAMHAGQRQAAERHYAAALLAEPNCARARLGAAALADGRGDATARRHHALAALAAHAQATGLPAYPQAVLRLGELALRQARAWADAAEAGE